MAVAAVAAAEGRPGRIPTGRPTDRPGGREGASAGFLLVRTAGLSSPREEDGRLGFAPAPPPPTDKMVLFCVAMRAEGRHEGAKRQINRGRLARDQCRETAGAGCLFVPRVHDWREGATTSDHNKTMWPRATAADDERREGRREGRET